MRRRDFIRSVGGAAALALPTTSLAGESDALPDRMPQTAMPQAGSYLLARQLADAQQHRLELLTLVHHMRTPLNAIAGYAELMAERHSGDMPDDMKVALDRITSASQHLAELINSAFDSARAERHA